MARGEPVRGPLVTGLQNSDSFSFDFSEKCFISQLHALVRFNPFPKRFVASTGYMKLVREAKKVWDIYLT